MNPNILSNQKALGLLAATLLLLVFCASLLGQSPSPSASQPAASPPGAAAGTAAGTASGTASTPAGPFSFADPIVRLPAGVQDATVDMILRSSTPQPAPPTLKAVDLPQPLAAKAAFQAVEDKNAPPNTWRYRVSIYGLAPATSQQHYAVVTYGDNKTQPLVYTLTNQPAGTFSWSVSKMPDPWVASGGDGACTAFTVTTRDAPATDVTVSSTLIEQTTKEGITLDSLRLCPAGSKCDGTQPVTIAANVPTALQLCTTKSFHGKFDGSVVLASRQKPDGDIVLQHAQFSSDGAKLFGFALILAGVVLAFVAKVWARALLDRKQALLPATRMRGQLAAMKKLLDQLDPHYKDAPAKIRAAITELDDELSDAMLDSRHFLPPKVPNPFGFTVDAAGYKTYLELRNPRIQLLSILVNEGVVPASKEDVGNPPSITKKDLVKTAIKDIDTIASGPAPSADQASQRVLQILTTLRSALSGGAAGAMAVMPQANRTLESLQLEVETISKGVWVLYGLLTALSGLVVLILNNPGYGVPLDYVLAFFWGFGLPMAVQSLVPGSAATALNISVPRST